MLYRIRNKQGLAWSNDMGWISSGDGDETLFTQEERDSFRLPWGNNVRWEKVRRGY